MGTGAIRFRTGYRPGRWLRPTRSKCGTQGTTTGTVTDSEGHYTLKVPASGGTLVYTFIGRVAQSVEIGSRNTIDLQLAQDASQLQEVVVSAGGIVVQKRELGNMATTVKSADIVQGKSVNPVAGLQGKVPGLFDQCSKLWC